MMTVINCLLILLVIAFFVLSKWKGWDAGISNWLLNILTSIIIDFDNQSSGLYHKDEIQMQSIVNKIIVQLTL